MPTIRSSERLIKMLSIIMILSELCGVNVVRKNYKMSWITWSVIILINIAFGFTFHTMYIGVAVKNEWTELLKCACMLSSGMQGYAKLINGLQKREQICFLYKEIINVYQIYEQKDKEYQKSLTKDVAFIKTVIFGLCGVYVGVASGLIGVPVFYLILLHQRVHIMQFFIPLIDPDTDFGFYCNFSLHIVCILFGAFGNFVNDSWFFVFVCHIGVFKNILKCKFNDLNEILKLHPRDLEKSKPLLRDIFQWHQKYIIFSETAKTAFFWVIFAQVGTAFLGIVCTIVCLFLGVWPAASVYLLYSFVIFYIYCALGNLVELANDAVTDLIYNSCWYLLTTPQQKMIQIMLRESQKTEVMSIGDLMPLSLNTALQLTKTIYTVAMMLEQFLN